MTQPVTGIQCAAERPVGGERAMFATLRCYLLDGHDGPHNDCTEGVTWEAQRLNSPGHIIRDYHRQGRPS
jgi:hypothetical protein